MIGRPSWWRRRGPVALLLLPLGLLYAILDSLARCLSRPQRAELPLICVGNLTAGGAGKTPVAQAIAQVVLNQGYRPAIISRGYGGAQENQRVDLNIHGAKDVGDEPLLHAQICPTYVGADRLISISAAKADGADLALMDDGLQHHRVVKDLVIEVRNAADGLGNGFPLPAGPLRQWFGLGQRQVDLTILVGRDAIIETTLPKGLVPGTRVTAFCGIADPIKFQRVLEGLDLKVTKFTAFPDHHVFSQGELSALSSDVQDGIVVTTQKDWVRLPKGLQAQVLAVPYGVRLQDPERIVAAIKAVL